MYIRKKIHPILDLDVSDATNLEIGIFNYAIKEATRKKIVKKWENPHFVSIYIDRLRSIYMNLKKIIISGRCSSNVWSDETKNNIKC